MIWMRIMLALSAVLAGILLPAGATVAQFECLDPRAFETGDITIYPTVGTFEEGVIVQIEVTNTFDMSVDSMVRYPYRAAVLRLRDDNTQTLSPPFVIPNLRYTMVKVSVVAVPTEATSESLNIIFSAFNVLVDAAADAALKKQPLLKVLAGYVANNISDEALAILQRGRIVGQIKVEAPTLVLGAIPAEEFTLSVQPICQ
jgi:hypothetical protein